MLITFAGNIYAITFNFGFGCQGQSLIRQHTFERQDLACTSSISTRRMPSVFWRHRPTLSFNIICMWAITQLLNEADLTFLCVNLIPICMDISDAVTPISEKKNFTYFVWIGGNWPSYYWETCINPFFPKVSCLSGCAIGRTLNRAISFKGATNFSF